MPFFAKQPIHCTNCGKAFMGWPSHDHWSWCSRTCLTELGWKHAQYVLGEENRPDPRLQKIRDRISDERNEEIIAHLVELLLIHGVDRIVSESDEEFNDHLAIAYKDLVSLSNQIHKPQ